MKKVVVTFLVDEDVLKEAYCQYMDIDEGDYSFADALNSELTCMEENGVGLFDWKSVSEE